MSWSPEAFYYLVILSSIILCDQNGKQVLFHNFVAHGFGPLGEDISDCDRHQKHLTANITQEITIGTQGNKPIFKREVFHMASF